MTQWASILEYFVPLLSQEANGLQDLLPFLGKISTSYIKNVSEFITKMVTSVPYNHKIVSFDITSLFTKVPIDHILKFLRGFLRNECFIVPISSFIALLHICMTRNVFNFNRFFGDSMNSCSSLLLSCLYIEYFEHRLLASVPLFSHIHIWYRY